MGTVGTGIPVAEDLIIACKQLVAIGTAVSILIMLPVNVVGMFILFTKADQMLNPNRLMVRQRHRAFMKRRA